MIRRLNKTIVACVLLLAGMGLLSLWTVAPPTDLDGRPVSSSIFIRQAAFLTIGLVLMVLTAVPNYAHYRRASIFLYVVGAISLLSLLVVGRYTRGARGWFSLGPINVQPAEVMKVAVVMALARVLMYGKNIHRIRGLILPVSVAAFPAALVLLQPDLGTALLFVPTLLAMLYVAGARKRHIAAMMALIMAAVPVAYFTVLKPYQRGRLIAFIAPDKATRDQVYQQKKSVQAVAAGGIIGNGIGESGAHLPFYVPDRHTDFIYSIIAEELGFVGSIFILILFGVLYVQSLRIARQTREPFGRLLVVGLTTLLATQTFINLGMTIGVAPITGVTLPFISYGGSSLVMCGLSMGLILNVSARWTPGFSSRDMEGGSVAIHQFQPQPVKWLAH